MVKQKLPPLETLIGLCRKYGAQKVADMYGVTRQAVHYAFRSACVEMPEREKSIIDAPLQERLKDALLYVLNAHQTPGDPYYAYARKVCPDILPEIKPFKFKDNETGQEITWCYICCTAPRGRNIRRSHRADGGRNLTGGERR